MPSYILWVYAGNSNYDRILWCVIWHFSSLKVWVEGLTVTKDSETLGFSHLGAPNLQLIWFLCTLVAHLVAHFQHWAHLMGLNVPEGFPQHCCKIPKPHSKDTSAMPSYILWVYAGNSNYDRILWCVIWHCSSLKVWVGVPTVTKDSETLGFSHLGTPNLQLIWFLCTLVAHFQHWVHLMGLNIPEGFPNIAARSQNPTAKTPQQCQVTFCGCMLGTVIMILGTVIMMESYDVWFGIFPH